MHESYRLQPVRPSYQLVRQIFQGQQKHMFFQPHPFQKQKSVDCVRISRTFMKPQQDACTISLNMATYIFSVSHMKILSRDSISLNQIEAGFKS